MEFVFCVSDYGDPALEGEAALLLEQRLAARSRKVLPWAWAATDRLDACAAKGPGRENRRTRYRVYGAVLLALGVAALVPGLAEPRSPILTGSGLFAIFSGILEFRLVREKKPPASCRKEASDFLAKRRSVDWSLPENRTELHFGEAGLSLSVGGQTEAVPYSDMAGIFETERLWLLLYGANQAALLQKKDLADGDAAGFLPFLRGKIANNT